jgi:hypothetical protein
MLLRSHRLCVCVCVHTVKIVGITTSTQLHRAVICVAACVVLYCVDGSGWCCGRCVDIRACQWLGARGASGGRGRVAG